MERESERDTNRYSSPSNHCTQYSSILHRKLGSRVTDNKNIARGLLSPTDLMQPNTGSAKTSANGSTAPLTVNPSNNSTVDIASNLTTGGNVKLELTTGGNNNNSVLSSVTTTTAQVITLVAPASNSTSNSTATHLVTGRSSGVDDAQTSPSCLPSSNTGNPVLVQVSTGGQLIAVAVSPESITQSNETQAPG